MWRTFAEKLFFHHFSTRKAKRKSFFFLITECSKWKDQQPRRDVRECGQIRSVETYRWWHLGIISLTALRRFQLYVASALFVLRDYYRRVHFSSSPYIDCGKPIRSIVVCAAAAAAAAFARWNTRISTLIIPIIRVPNYLTTRVPMYSYRTAIGIPHKSGTRVA